MNKELNNKAQGIFKSMPEQKELFVNNKGEFFTNENYCRNSVKKDSEYSVIKRSDVIEEKAPEDGSEEPLTIESLKAKGDSLGGFLKDQGRAELNAMDSLFDFSVTELPNKGACVDAILEAVSK